MFDTKPQIDINVNTKEIENQISYLKNAIKDKTDMESRCHQENLKLKEKQWEEEMQLRDRVDISKKEYLQLLKENKEYKEGYNRLLELFKTLIYEPFKEAKINPSITDKIASGEVKARVFTNENIYNFTTRIFLEFVVKGETK